MLLHSPLPFSPTRTTEGYMTSFECLRKSPPNLWQLRIWGCRAYVLKPKADRPKDFDAKAYSGILWAMEKVMKCSYQIRTSTGD